MNDLDLAVAGNCTVATLITRSGRHVWFCFPRLDADPIFCALLGGDASDRGFMDAELRGQVSTEQSYLQNTAIVETTLRDTDGGAARILDFCPRFARYGRMFRPPMVVRRIEPLAGSPRITVRLRPVSGYGATIPERSIGSNHMRFIATDSTLRLTTDMPLSYVAHEADFTLDRPVTLFLGADESVPDEPDALGQSFLHQTIVYWREWVRDLNIPFDWQLAVIRAAITLKLCSFDDTGGIVAALTTSIPEAPGSGRNWDYRFCWPRDAYFTVDALNRLSATRTMESFMRYLIDTMQREPRAEIAPLYPISPGANLSERIAVWLDHTDRRADVLG
jgi:GH15 family glucan-1,4-alpha-glucosidase